MSSGNDPITRDDFNGFMDKFADSLNEAFGHLWRRLDDIEERLESLEARIDTTQKDIVDIKSNVHTVKNEARLIRPMFELTQMDSAEIGKLTLRVDNLE
ncbi:MAG: hypothetical protein OXP12_09245 [Thaumarchaeota archaeon]|nr:hypothetical protein [Nitrososphaerota archaeon]